MLFSTIFILFIIVISSILEIEVFKSPIKKGKKYMIVLWMMLMEFAIIFWIIAWHLQLGH